MFHSGKSAYLLKDNRSTVFTLRFLLVNLISKIEIVNSHNELVKTCLVDSANFVLGFYVEKNKVSGVKFLEKTKNDTNLHKALFSNAKVTHSYFRCL